MDRYLGDGVYASFDSYQIWLRADSFGQMHRIALEPPVFDALLAYQRDLGRGAAPPEMTPIEVIPIVATLPEQHLGKAVFVQGDDRLWRWDGAKYTVDPVLKSTAAPK